MALNAPLRSTPAPRTYPIAELVDQTGFSSHQIRRLIHAGVLPRAVGRGPTAYYTDVHLNRLLRIRKEREQRRTLADFADYFNRGRARA